MIVLPRNTILLGDACEQLRNLPDAGIDCVITSPPYFLLRNYGVEGQLGSEPDVGLWVTALQKICRELARVLKPDGALWLNLGDSFSRHPRFGAPPKSLLLAPERLLLALAEDGWIVRNKVIWAKTNPMPTSVSDRLNLSYDFVYFLVRAPRYYFDLDAIREPHRSRGARSARAGPSLPPSWAGPLAGTQSGLRRARPAGLPGHVLGKNPGDVWFLSTQPFRDAHFATFPEKLIERPLLATCPERLCDQCGVPWRRQSEIAVLGKRVTATHGSVRRYPRRWATLRRRGPVKPACSCQASWRAGIVLDPFMGSGTVAVVAERLQRDWIGIELNPQYVAIARDRLRRARGISSVSCGSRTASHVGLPGRNRTEEVAVMETAARP